MKINRKLFLEEVLKTRGNRGEQYCKYSGLNFMIDWCAIFTSYIMREVAGIKDFPNDFPKSTSCTQIKNSSFAIPKLNRSFKTAEVGDVIFFELKNPSDGPEHIGIVVANDNGIISVLEGNTGNNDYNKSYVAVYTYSVDNSALDCIIDMSDFFTDELIQNTEKPVIKSSETQMREVFKKIKELLLSIEI